MTVPVRTRVARFLRFWVTLPVSAVSCTAVWIVETNRGVPPGDRR